MHNEQKMQNGAGILAGETDHKPEMSNVCSALLVCVLEAHERGLGQGTARAPPAA